MSGACFDPIGTIRLGRVTVSRFIVGHNPPSGNSHIDEAANADMRAYFTAENVLKLYQQAEGLGVRTLMIRGDYTMLHWLELYRRGGGRMNVIAQTASEMHDIFQNIRVMATAGVEAVYHHGTQTDKFWRLGQIARTRDYLKCMRDCGVAVGLGTHQPEIIDYAQQHGWDVDFYMASLYNLSRVPRESSVVTGRSAYDQEIYLDEDRDNMLRTIAGANKPALAFKLLAAGRKCANQDTVRAAFAYTISRLRACDGIVIGLFPKYVDQVKLDLEHAAAAGLAQEQQCGQAARPAAGGTSAAGMV